ncbi:hypothetical protein HR060_17160 [Catenovulum sp. SM1970]|uniref:hypothetical protein n=1 Tax=Marinifaba aquimaris TaxID=2741323 RepID=UPI0015748B67|nr:hypothetical protein [Marinifaba aquimaris]NTS78575.1 hypothetical protein [Marinifaba aquimaris]
MLEKRVCQLSAKQWQDELNNAQRVSARTLMGLGYDLEFVRGVDHNSLAVFTLGESIVTIDAEGDTNTTPNISIR